MSPVITNSSTIVAAADTRVRTAARCSRNRSAVAGGRLSSHHRSTTQAAYWWMQARDELDEARSPRPDAALRHM